VLTTRRLYLALLVLPSLALLIAIPIGCAILLLAFDGRVRLDLPYPPPRSSSSPPAFAPGSSGSVPTWTATTRPSSCFPLAAAVRTVAWYLSHRRQPPRPGTRGRFLYLTCRAAIPLGLIDLALVDLGTIACLLAIALVVGLTYLLSSAVNAIANRHENLATRRLRAGLCPHCGYDVARHPRPLPRVRPPVPLLPLPLEPRG
jgi:hypothetical protein